MLWAIFLVLQTTDCGPTVKDGLPVCEPNDCETIALRSRSVALSRAFCEVLA
jgi:hypothetical protein